MLWQIIGAAIIMLAACYKPDPVNLKVHDTPPEWVEVLGDWEWSDTMVTVGGNGGTVQQSVLKNGKMWDDSHWSEISVDFKIAGEVRYTAAGLALNIQDSSDFGIFRIGRMSLEVGLWKYDHYRPWMHVPFTTVLRDRWYNLSIRKYIKENDWRPWTLTLTDLENGKVLLRQGIDNTFPLFGQGAAGLYAVEKKENETDRNVIFRRFQVVLDDRSERKRLLKVPSVFSDGMILQRGVPVPVWGLAQPGVEVKVAWEGCYYGTTADDSGRWRVVLPAGPASVSLQMTIISPTDTILIRDIDVGEVWLASGQSNMGMMVWQTDMRGIAEQQLTDDHLRMFRQPQWPSAEPVFDGGGHWEKAESEMTREWSALAYSFALQLREKLGVPVGILGSYWGGTSAESWLPREVLGTDPATRSILEDYNRALAALKEGRSIPSGIHPFNIPDQSHAPGYLYNGMIYPLIPYAMQGVIWYQGESNTLRAKQYETLFPMLIRSWREAWEDPEMNFFYVQLAAYDGKLSGNDVVNAWPHIREVQRLTLYKLDHTGMAVAIDLGDHTNIHPYRKNELGKRLARLAFHDVYGYNDIVRCGPLYRSVRFMKGSAFIDFSETAAGLEVRNNAALKGFVIAGADQRFVPASAEILSDGNSVRVWAYGLDDPVAVRYAWENDPAEANLINSAGLPASPFRTDEWPLY
jgi:sialate O-acetylesterase